MLNFSDDDDPAALDITETDEDDTLRTIDTTINSTIDWALIELAAAVTYKREYRNCEGKLKIKKPWLIENLNTTSYLIIIANTHATPNQFNLALLLGFINS